MTNRTDHEVVRAARQALAEASTATTNLGRMNSPEMGGLIGRLAGTMQGLLEYVDLMHERAELTQQIAEDERSERETRALLAETTGGRPTAAPAVHTNALDHQLADALHTADTIRFKTDRDTDAAHRHAVEAWSGATYCKAVRATPGEALTAAIAALKTAAQVTR